MTIAFLSTLAWGADCPTAVPLTEWSATLGAAEEAYRTLDAETFDDTLDEAALDLRCLSEVVSRDAAARYHLLAGLRLYVRTRIEDAVAEFSAARAADPALVVDERLVPAGHELRSLIPGQVPSPTEAFPAPAEGVTLALDGSAASARPVDRPVIVQVVGVDGQIRETAYLMPGDPLPAYPVMVRVAPLDPLPGPSPEPLHPPPVERRPKWAVLGASGAAAAASIVLYAVAARSEAKFNAPLPDEYGRDELVGLRQRTNALVLGSVVAGSFATGGMVVFVVTR